MFWGAQDEHDEFQHDVQTLGAVDVPLGRAQTKIRKIDGQIAAKPTGELEGQLIREMMKQRCCPQGTHDSPTQRALRIIVATTTNYSLHYDEWVIWPRT